MIFKFISLATALVLTQLIPIPAANAQTFTGIVVSVGDGDTIQAKFGSKKVTIRLACIDAPEIKQTPWGKQSADRLKKLLPVGQSIKVRSVTQDRYKRLVGEIYVSDRSINLTMVREGQAVVYTEYLQGCADTKSQFIQSEAEAKNKKLGFWNQTNPVMPWDFRRSKEVVSTPAQQTTQKQCDRSQRLP
ncbi:thermonuclease family protein [Nodularia chucula]|uniref:thermonuclease family protein n=1 Tax=Nodularia chucula TaxID=3093667 RepID=UPI0039C5CFB7